MLSLHQGSTNAFRCVSLLLPLVKLVLIQIVLVVLFNWILFRAAFIFN